jgi:single-stranded DNA-binding protein
MSAQALINGTLYRAAERRTAKSGRAFTIATLRSTEGQTSQFWRVTAFSESAGEELARLNEGEAVAVQGRLDIGTYDKDGETRVSFQIIADHVLALRQPGKERKPKPAPPADTRTREERCRGVADPRFNDNPPF